MTNKVPPAMAKKWARILAESGFKDIEDERGVIKADTSKRRMESRSAEDREAREKYYTAATHFLHAHDWTGNERGKLVWALHVQGKGVRLIARETAWGHKMVHESVRDSQAKLRLHVQEGAEFGEGMDDGDA